jgi:bcep22gp58
VKVKDIINRVTALYNDADYVRLTKAQYLRFLDDAINQLIAVRPDSYVTIEPVKLKPGNRQDIPDDAYCLVDIYSNAVKNPDGSFTYGPPIYQVERKDMDYYSNWYKNTFSNTGIVMEFMYDRKTPRTFFVYPAVPSGRDVFVEMAVSKQAPEFSSLTDDFDVVMEMDMPVTGVFKTPLINYMLYLVYNTDSTSANDRQMAATYEQSFYRGLGQEYNASIVAMPKIVEPAMIAGTGEQNG